MYLLAISSRGRPAHVMPPPATPKSMLRHSVSLALMVVVMTSAAPTWAQESPEARVRRLVAALEDSDPVRSAEAAFELQQRGDARAVPALLRALRTTNGATRRAVLIALRRFKDRRTTDALLELLQFNHKYDREPADQLAALGDTGYRALLRYVDECQTDAGRSELGADALASFDGTVVFPRVVAMVRHRLPCRRRMAVLALKHFGGADTGLSVSAIRLLQAAALDPDEMIADAARAVLADLSDSYGTSDVDEPHDIPGDIRAQLEGDDPADRLLGIEWLADHPVPQATPLLATLGSDADETVRMKAVSILGAINAMSTSGRDERERDPAGALPALLKSLEDPAPPVRAAAAAGLADIAYGVDRAAVLDALIDKVDDIDTRVRAEVLASLGSLRATTALRNPDLADAVVPLLKDPDEHVRRRAAFAARLVLDESHTRHTLALIAALEEPALRWDVVWALRTLRDARAVPALAALIGVPGYPMCSACVALGVIGGPSAVAALLQAATHPWEPVREGAVQALAALADPRARQVFESSLRDPEVDVRRAAVRGLAALKGDAAVEALLPSLMDTSEFIRQEVARTLGTLRDPRAVPALIRVLPRMVPDAASALAAIGDRSAVDPLVAALPTSAPWHQADIVRALGRLGDPRAVAPLLALLRTGSPETQDPGLAAALVEALGALGDSRAGAALRERLERLPPSGFHPLREPLLKAIEKLSVPRPQPI